MVERFLSREHEAFFAFRFQPMPHLLGSLNSFGPRALPADAARRAAPPIDRSKLDSSRSSTRATASRRCLGTGRIRTRYGAIATLWFSELAKSLAAPGDGPYVTYGEIIDDIGGWPSATSTKTSRASSATLSLA